MRKIIEIASKKAFISAACLIALGIYSEFSIAETNLMSFDAALTGWDSNSVAIGPNTTSVLTQNITVTNSAVSFSLGPNPFTISPASGSYMVALNPDGLNGSTNIVLDNTGLSGGFNIDSYLGLPAHTFYNTLYISGNSNSQPTNVAVISKDISLTSGITYKFNWAYAAQDYDPFKDGVFFSYSKGAVVI